MNRFGLVIIPALVLAALFAWLVKGDLEMGWFVAGPAIAVVALGLALLGSVVVPPGFARAAVGLTAFPYGLLLAWVAAATPNQWPVTAAPEWLAQARLLTTSTQQLRELVEFDLGIPVELGGASVESTAGFRRKVSGRLLLERREPVVFVVVSFAVGPVRSVRYRVAADGDATLEPPSPDTGQLTIRPFAIERRFGGVPLVEVGGTGPVSPGQLVPLRRLRGDNDWDLVLIRIAADSEAIAEVGRHSRGTIEARFADALRRRGERATRIQTYFQPAGDRVLFMNRPSFDFQARLEASGFADLRARLDADSIVFEVLSVRR